MVSHNAWPPSPSSFRWDTCNQNAGADEYSARIRWRPAALGCTQKVGDLGKVLTNQAIDVPVNAELLRAMWVAKVDSHAGTLSNALSEHFGESWLRMNGAEHLRL